MDDKVCLVTGANSGIGRVTARELHRQGARVVMVCRSRERGEAALRGIEEETGRGGVELIQADLGRAADIRAMGEAFASRHDRLDVLVNNAGLYLPARRVTDDGHEAMFGINHLGYHLVVQALLDPLRAAASARIINVSSDGHRFGKVRLHDLDAEQRFNGLLQYCHTKLMNILFTRALARRLPEHVTANALHPGTIRSGFAQDEKSLFGWLVRMSRLFLITPEEGAETTLHLATSPDVEGVTGRYFAKSREKSPSKRARDDDVAEQLWARTAEITGVDHLA
jgi:NAD(P)-dependent dehydrogenase (short-subunit alcohol dehydrogenase family)